MPVSKISLSVEHPEGDAVGVRFDGDSELLLLVGVEETGEGVGVKPGVLADLNGGTCTDALDGRQGGRQRLQAVHVRICHSQNVRKVITKVLILRSCHIVHLNVNTTVSSIPPTNLPYIKTAMMRFAPLSRETGLNWDRFIRRVGRNTEQEDLAVRVASNKTGSVTVPPLELSVKRALQFWLKRRVQIKPQFDRRKPMFESDDDQSVNRGLVQREREQFNHPSRGLYESLIA